MEKTSKQVRTQDVIDGFRGLPGEFMMLKGLLCLAHTIERAEEKRNGWKSGADARKKVHAILNTVMIAKRMDAINAGDIADATHSIEVANGVHGYIGSAAHKEDVRENGGQRTA